VRGYSFWFELTHSTAVIARLVRATQLSFRPETNWVARMKRAMTILGEVFHAAARQLDGRVKPAHDGGFY
jgi:hypothetical protein